MKNIKKIFAIALAVVMLLSCVPAASAATSETSVVDYDADCSLTIYAFNWTDSYKDGVVDENTFTSSGWQDTVVEETFINATPVGGSHEQVLGNSQTSNGYAVKGAEFTILNLAMPLRYNEVVDEETAQYFLNHQIFMFERPKADDFLKAIDLADGAGQCELPADMAAVNELYWIYTSDTIIDALAQALENNATEVKDALETYIKSNGGIKMDLTDADGRTAMDSLKVGLYLVVETAVPETVTATTNPFLISLPMTTVNNNTEGTAPEGGHEWNYDVTVYPKNTSGIPTLEKTVREAVSDTGTNNGSDTITDGFAHTATGSAGDTMEYQIVSSLPTITSQATALSSYNFFDTIAPGMTYNKDVKIEFFTDKNCTDKVATWTQDDGRFTVSYSEDGQSMTIDVTAAGLAEINGDTENTNGSLYAGYSNYTARVTYSADINSDTSFVYGEEGNCNKVVLTWKRTSADYYDTLIDDAHIYSFGMNLNKLFSDMSAENAAAEGKYEHVKFIVNNTTDNIWLIAELNEAEGVYYVVGHTDKEDEATIFTPVSSGDEYGKVIIRGMENDKYEIYEIETADGYTLLSTALVLNIEVFTNQNKVCDIYSEDVLGLLQNDPRYKYSNGKDLSFTNVPQKLMQHFGIDAKANAGGDKIGMLSDGTSKNAEASITVINTRGFDLPQTGDNGVWMYGVAGGTLMIAAVLVIFFAFRKKEEEQTVQH